ncbi:hypothetical protein Ahy_B09g097934 [Arachis hypogaea]|uniref:Aminotransferase-like plant mobile domain-containing protein n=1 Tax=Arachis hypogaea TaxID=3818 RepID=A0A444XQ72_ARAHY|nr:hypothetical protein Ahy_B09g097934 [Arachis hypogaea]
MLLRTQLFGYKSGTHLHIRWLPYVARFKDMGGYSWRSVALSWLYRCMCRVMNRNIVNCFSHGSSDGFLISGPLDMIPFASLWPRRDVIFMCYVVKSQLDCEREMISSCSLEAQDRSPSGWGCEYFVKSK